MVMLSLCSMAKAIDSALGKGSHASGSRGKESGGDREMVIVRKKAMQNVGVCDASPVCRSDRSYRSHRLVVVCGGGPLYGCCDDCGVFQLGLRNDDACAAFGPSPW